MGARVGILGLTLLLAGCGPSATAAPVTWPTGRYTVPAEMPYGTYIAGNVPGAYPGCIWSTWTHDGIPIDVYDMTLSDSAAVVEIYSPAIATFTSSAGCTAWVKIG